MAELDFSPHSALVIDDEPFTRRVLSRVLTLFGFGIVLETGDGVHGLALAQNGKVDVVLCDVNMKPLNGIDILHHLRTSERPGLVSLPLVFLTALATPQVVDAAQASSNVALLVKPVNPAALRETLVELLG